MSGGGISMPMFFFSTAILAGGSNVLLDGHLAGDGNILFDGPLRPEMVMFFLDGLPEVVIFFSTVALAGDSNVLLNSHWRW